LHHYTTMSRRQAFKYRDQCAYKLYKRCKGRFAEEIANFSIGSDPLDSGRGKHGNPLGFPAAAYPAQSERLYRLGKIPFSDFGARNFGDRATLLYMQYAGSPAWAILVTADASGSA
jgi:hypothetical protein